jgi:hypothetical protein
MWIWRRSLPLLTQKMSIKQLQKVMLGFLSVPSLCWLRNSQPKLSRCRLRNHHRNTFQRWRARIQNCSQPLLTQKSQGKPSRCRLKKSSTKHLPHVTPGFVRAQSPYWVRNSHQKLSRCRLKNYHRNRFHRWCVDSLALTALVKSEKVNENEVSVEWKIINKTPSKGDIWIRQCAQTLLS